MIRGMQILAIGAALAGAACASGGTPSTPTPTKDHPGAATPTIAIQALMAAVKAQDLDEMSLIWGSDKGPARDVVPSDQLRKREMIMVCYLQHDSYKVMSDIATTSTTHVVTIAVTKGSFTRETKTPVVQGPGGRWYVGSLDLQPLQDLCSGQSTTK